MKTLIFCLSLKLKRFASAAGLVWFLLISATANLWMLLSFWLRTLQRDMILYPSGQRLPSWASFSWVYQQANSCKFFYWEFATLMNCSYCRVNLTAAIMLQNQPSMPFCQKAKSSTSLHAWVVQPCFVWVLQPLSGASRLQQTSCWPTATDNQTSKSKLWKAEDRQSVVSNLHPYTKRGPNQWIKMASSAQSTSQFTGEHLWTSHKNLLKRHKSNEKTHLQESQPKANTTNYTTSPLWASHQEMV